MSSILNFEGLQFFQGYSLVAITPTGVVRSIDFDNTERNQQRNWETVLQCMSLRTQPLHIQTPQLLHIYDPSFNDSTSNLCDLSLLDFGAFYSGNHKVWTWSWAVEARDVYSLFGNSLGALNQDFEQVPIITCLSETARFMLPIFYPYGSIKNIYFKQIMLSRTEL